MARTIETSQQILPVHRASRWREAVQIVINTVTKNRIHVVTNLLLLGTALVFFAGARIELREKIAQTDVTLIITRNLADPMLAPKSLWTTYANHTFTLAHRIPAFIARQFGADVYFLEELRFLFSIIAAAFGIFYLSLSLFHDRLTSFISVLLIFSSRLSYLGWYFPINFLDRPYDAYTSLATVIVAMAFLYWNKPKSSLFIAGYLFNYHVVHSLLIFVLLIACLLMSKRYGWRSMFAFCAIYLLGCTPLLAYGFFINPDLISFVPADIPSVQWWKLIRIMKYTTIFPTSMGFQYFVKEVAFALAFFSVLLAQIREERKGNEPCTIGGLQRHQYSLTILGGVIVFAVIGTVFTEWLPLSRFLASAQPYRSSTYLMVLAAAYVCFYLVSLLRSQDWFAKFSGLLCFVLLGTGCGSPECQGVGTLSGAMILLSGIVVYWSSVHHKLFPFAAECLAMARQRWHETSPLFKISLVSVATILLSVLAFASVWIYFNVFQSVFNALAVSRMVKIFALIWISGWLLRLFYPALDFRFWSTSSLSSPYLRSTAVLFLATVIALHYFVSNGIIANANPEQHERLIAWRDLQLWARSSTPKGSIFINPFDSEGFETLSERTALLSAAELGSLSLYVPDSFFDEISRAKDYGVDVLELPSYVSGRWAVSKLMAEKYKLFMEKDFVRLGTKYGASYVIVDAEKSLSFPKVYNNKRFAVYQMDVNH